MESASTAPTGWREAGILITFFHGPGIPTTVFDNLVAAHTRCNNAKSATLAGLGHLRLWMERFGDTSTNLRVEAVKLSTGWPRRPDRVLSIARATYLWLPEGTRLWRENSAYDRLDAVEVRAIFRTGPYTRSRRFPACRSVRACESLTISSSVTASRKSSRPTGIVRSRTFWTSPAIMPRCSTSWSRRRRKPNRQQHSISLQNWLTCWRYSGPSCSPPA